MAFSCDVGDVAYIVCTFTNAGGTLVAPTTITLYLQQPSGSVGTYTAASGSVASPATGTYTFNGTATEAGYWDVRWVGDGAAVAAQQGRYFVRSINT
jgi:PKD repeat protein